MKGERHADGKEENGVEGRYLARKSALQTASRYGHEALVRLLERNALRPNIMPFQPSPRDLFLMASAVHCLNISFRQDQTSHRSVHIVQNTKLAGGDAGSWKGC